MKLTFTMILLYTAAVFHTHTARGEDNWVYYDSFDALYNIREITEDLDGNLWAAAYDSICFFDGNLWTITPASQIGINEIYEVCVDYNNDVWFGGRYGLAKYSNETWTLITNLPFLNTEEPNILEIAMDHNNHIWVSIDGCGLYCYDGEQWIFYDPGICGFAGSSIVIDKNNNVWVGGYRFNGDKWENFTYGPSNNVTSDGIFYYPTRWGIGKFDGSDYTTFFIDDGLGDQVILDLVVDQNDILWVCTEERLASFDGESWTNYTYEKTSFQGKKARCVFVDRQNNKLFGTYRNVRGIAKFNDSIVNEIQLLSPLGGVRLNKGETHTIKWWSHQLLSVDIAYSTDSGISWIQIASSIAPETKSYGWKTPNEPIENALIRVSYSDNPLISGQSSAPFQIASPPFPELQITSPAGGETPCSGDAFPVKWSANGISTISIDYSVDEGINWHEIVQEVPGEQPGFYWNLPNISAESCIIRFRDTQNPEFSVISQPFQIIENSVIVVWPNGGEIFDPEVELKMQCDFTPGVKSINFEYSFNGGETWTAIAENIPYKSYLFTFPNPPEDAAQCLIKITDSINPDITDVSDGFFTVRHLYDQDLIGWTNYNGKDINTYWTWVNTNVLEPDPINGIWFNVRGYEWASIHHLGTTINVGLHVPTTMMSSSIGAIAFDSSGDVWVSAPNSHDTDSLPMTTDHYLSVYKNSGWERIDGAPSYIMDIEFDSNGVPWFAAYKGIYKYENDTWTHFGPQEFDMPDDNVKLLEIDKDGSLWFSYDQTNYPGLYRLNNGELTHCTDINGLTLNNITSIDIDQRDYLWVTTNESVVYFDGSNWNSYTKNDGLPVDSINDIAVNPSGTFWLATNEGAVYYDGTSYKTYNKYNCPIETNTVVLTTIDADNNVWFATPTGICMYKQSQITSVEKEKRIPLDYDKITNYPNPFNPITNISFSLIEDAFKTIIIYNINGQKVCKLMAESLQAGTHSVTWDGLDDSGKPVSSGIYFSRLKSSGNIATGKMVLLR